MYIWSLTISYNLVLSHQDVNRYSCGIIFGIIHMYIVIYDVNFMEIQFYNSNISFVYL